MENKALMMTVSVVNKLSKCNDHYLTCDEPRLDCQSYESFHDIARFLKACVPLFQLEKFVTIGINSSCQPLEILTNIVHHDDRNCCVAAGNAYSPDLVWKYQSL